MVLLFYICGQRLHLTAVRFAGLRRDYSPSQIWVSPHVTRTLVGSAPKGGVVVTVNNIAHAHATRAAAFEAKIATLDRHQLRILYPQNWIFLAVMSTVQNLTKQVQVPLAPNFRAMPTEESTLKQFQNLTRWPPAKLLNAGMLLYNDKGIQTHSGM